VVMIDQTRLPSEEEYVTCRTYQEVAEAIRSMVIRGAPAIGVAAAMGVALGVKGASPESDGSPDSDRTGAGLVAATAERLDREMETICSTLAATRPTAVNLFWAIDRMKAVFSDAVRAGRSPDEIGGIMVAEAGRIHDEDVACCRALGAYGAELLPEDGRVLTHCNAGALATGGYGTALGVIRAAVEGGKRIAVYADETRPFLQGSRLTAWELLRDGIDTTIVTDGTAGSLFRGGRIDTVVVGADRIAANGDVANKIGTYTVAVLAREHDVPFYVAAPTSTIDLATADGAGIPIEERSSREVTHVGSSRVAPEGVGVWNPAFDVTPHRFVAGIITERGICRAPYGESLAAVCDRG
jgi:methylthioribose-1-phosphate isomerase